MRIEDIKGNIQRPDNWDSMSKEEKSEFARNSYSIAVQEMRELDLYLSKIPYNKWHIDVAKIQFMFKKYTEDPSNVWNFSEYTIAMDFNGALWRSMYGYYFENYIPLERIYPKLQPLCAEDQRWIEMEKRKKREEEKLEKKQVKQKNSTVFNVPNYNDNSNCTNMHYYEKLVGAPDIGRQEHKIYTDSNGNKTYPTRPMKYKSLDGLWILIPVCLFLCLTGWGGVIFSIIAIIAYLKYAEKEAQEIWERDCDFYDTITPKEIYVKDHFNLSNIDVDKYK